MKLDIVLKENNTPIEEIRIIDDILEDIESFDLEDEYEDDYIDVRIYETHIVELTLKNYTISHIPESIKDLKYLKGITFEDINFTSFPEQIFKISDLFFLKILYCKSLTHLPASIGNLQSIKAINIEWTSLISLPESFGNLNTLRELNLSHNKLRTLPKSFGNLVNLRFLVLSDNSLLKLPD